MSEVIKNSVTGLYNLQIGNSVFESEDADHFIGFGRCSRKFD